MGKIQNLNLSKENTAAFFLIVAVIILITFVLFTPKVASTLFPFKRQAVWNEFLSSVKNDQKIDSRKFWEFREFYSPGYFLYSSSGVDRNNVQPANDKINIMLNPQISPFAFAVFTAPKLTSIDSLIEKNDLQSVLMQPKQQNIVFKNKNSIIYKEGDKLIKIVFVLPENEMKRAVGFFEYDGKDKELLKGKYWMNTTTVELD